MIQEKVGVSISTSAPSVLSTDPSVGIAIPYKWDVGNWDSDTKWDSLKTTDNSLSPIGSFFSVKDNITSVNMLSEISPSISIDNQRPSNVISVYRKKEETVTFNGDVPFDGDIPFGVFRWVNDVPITNIREAKCQLTIQQIKTPLSIR